jgi:hypothetical protein
MAGFQAYRVHLCTARLSGSLGIELGGAVWSQESRF